MTITKRPTSGGQAQSADDFIARAPDAAHDAVADTKRRRKEVISLGIDERLLKRIDALAARSGLSRAAAISLAVARFVEEKGE
ncbi:ribbon-helix-helix protein, CopG family [Paraburkholderia heleia]|uniref:ribbon-helix-helix protein, CopG family n=1 Tax=Paraburkholderia heleia TaxID=634127 RepID=UPI0031D8BBDD